MKFKYIFASLAAALGLVAVSCEKETEEHLSEIKVSSSYVAIPADGGSVEVTVTAEDVWAFGELPEWLSVSPASGIAGESTVVFSAEAAEDTREASLSITCKEKSQTIKVIQMTEKKDLAVTPIADVIAAGAGTFRICGMVTKIANDQYGNFYMEDETGSIYIYGTKDAQGYPKDGNGGWARFGIDAGDTVTVEGPYTLYGTTSELVDVAVIKVEKSLISIDGVDYGTTTVDGEEVALTAIPAEGGDVILKVTAKVTPVIVTSDASWLQVTDVKDGNYVLTAAANDYTAVRKANVTVKGEGAVAVVEIAQDGIPATGASVTDIVAMDDDSQIETLESTVIAKTQRGVVIWDGTTALYVYDTAKLADVLVGDNVKIFGKKTTYNGVPEVTDVTDVVVYSHDNTFEVPAATDVTASAGEYDADKAEYIKLSGTLAVSGNYYNIALDAFPEGDKQGSIVYPVDELDAKSFDGKKITVTGWFNGLSSKGKYINVIATKIVEFVDNPKGSATNPYTPSEIAAEILAGNIPEEDVYIKGIVSAVLYTASASYPTATFWLSDDGTAYGVSEDKKTTTEPSKDFECYSVKWFGNADWAEGNGQVTVGDEVVVCGKTTAYNGVAETASKKAWLYSVNYVKTAGVGLGSTEFPFNVAGAEEAIDFQQAEIAAAKAAEATTPTFKDVCVKGIISDILYTFSASYGTGTFWISDDGTNNGIAADHKSTTVPAKDFECYSVYMFGINNPWVEGTSPQPAIGDEVVVKGQLTKYNTTYETASKKAWIYSINGATE